ncbi:MAG: type II toxin-antitoxin system VapC family toxin [Clostridia bacterium]|nr:type II toxin-antitoxin system VapC family toxin [Clostridia bacterium]
MIVVDSCGWLEFYADGPLAEEYAKYLIDLEAVVTPALVIYEVYKKVKRERGEPDALMAVGPMQKTLIVPFDTRVGLLAADLSLAFNLPLADAAIYATAQLHNCNVVTSDQHFKELPGVIYLRPPQSI